MNEIPNNFRVFVDSNILVSAVLSRDSLSSKLLHLLVNHHRIVICSYSITEVSKVIATKFPERISIWDRFLSQLKFDLTYTPSNPSSFDAPPIRDKKDLPILVSAIIAQPDILVSGDLDFHTKEIMNCFPVYTPSDFIRNFS